MLIQKKALLLIGSPKIKKSTSEALGNYVLDGLNKKGYVCEKLHILSMLKKDARELINRVKDTDILIISFPLYVDSLPSPLIKALELMADNRKEKRPEKEQSLMVIVNCGFPEAFQNDTALRICKSFANKTGFKWLGGLAMGSGSAIDGRPIEQLGGMTRNIVKALNNATEAIVNNENVPTEAINLMAAKLIPRWLYIFFGNIGWKNQAKKHNVDKILYSKPLFKNN
ncbi:Putative NADPH-quinone reductase (modulator of drug activity B) [Anaerovirgula multivorans]|uniref:Putative NADPH-quinone reductase (Modulator of drug activity B) n=1 Tax=Anaerovirgula multivorans TaxID=312168 RepID=A0A239CCS6_9FIRM|nr:NAD(P)H-dependent oxidoreductase [Anaerovirgula multivorans]SNS18025.1 Putative NADPH-quinone reductase (modulator of drug activity B) [Anaerovirgula multivorans]